MNAEVKEFWKDTVEIAKMAVRRFFAPVTFSGDAYRSYYLTKKEWSVESSNTNGEQPSDEADLPNELPPAPLEDDGKAGEKVGPEAGGVSVTVVRGVHPTKPQGGDMIVEVDLPDLRIDSLSGPVEMIAVRTKLDLARAHIELGDPDGARRILENVLSEGDEELFVQARDLLTYIGR